MHQAAPALSLLPSSSPSLSADASATASACVPGSTRTDSDLGAQSAPGFAFAASPWRRLGLAGFVAIAHVAGLAALAHLGQERPTPVELVPIQVALIAAEPTSPPPPEPLPTPPRPPEPIPPAPPVPELRPPDPVPPPPKAVVKKPAPKPVVKRPAPVTESPTALSAAAEAAPPSPTPPAPAAAPPVPVPVAAPATVTAARFDAAYLNNPRPGYPPLSRRLREEGQVTLRVLVSPDGSPAQVELRASSGSERLDRAAREAVARWRFVPARRGDTAIESWVLVPIVFKLQGN